jgi:hypothetical protein
MSTKTIIAGLTILAFAQPVLGNPAPLPVAANDQAPMAEKPVNAPANPPTIDTNKDGKPDAWDRDGNGKADAWDSDGDGQPDKFDNNGDGKPD